MPDLIPDVAVLTTHPSYAKQLADAQAIIAKDGEHRPLKLLYDPFRGNWELCPRSTVSTSMTEMVGDQLHFVTIEPHVLVTATGVEPLTLTKQAGDIIYRDKRVAIVEAVGFPFVTIERSETITFASTRACITYYTQRGYDVLTIDKANKMVHLRHHAQMPKTPVPVFGQSPR